MAKQQTFEAFIANERQRLGKLREETLAKKQQADDELAKIDRELSAIAAYEAAKKGKPIRQKRASGGPRGEKRAQLLRIINEAPGGLTRGDILEKMNLKGNKSGEQSVSNALNALKKGGHIKSDEGKYLSV